MGYGGTCFGLSKPRHNGESAAMSAYPVVSMPAYYSDGYCRPYFMIIPEFDPATDICTPVASVKYPQSYGIYLEAILINGGEIRFTTTTLNEPGGPYEVGDKVGSLVYDGSGHWVGTLTMPVGGTISVDAILGSCVPSSGLIVTYNGQYKGTGVGYNNSVNALAPDSLWLGETWYDGSNSWGGVLHPDCPLGGHPKIYQGVPKSYTTWGVTLEHNSAATSPITKAPSSNLRWKWQVAGWPKTLAAGEKGYAELTTGNHLELTVGTSTGNKTGGFAQPDGKLDYLSSMTMDQYPLYPNPLVSELPANVAVVPDLTIYS